MSLDINRARPLMLGCSAWANRDWAAHYFPDDLPTDWRLAYYANDFDFAVIEAARWRSKLDDLAEMVDEVGDALRYFVFQPDNDAEVATRLSALLGESRSVIMHTQARALPGKAVQWLATADDGWTDPASGERVQRWVIDRFDLRDLRDRATALQPATRALWLDGPAFSPDRLSEIRALLQLMGRA